LGIGIRDWELGIGVSEIEESRCGKRGEVRAGMGLDGCRWSGRVGSDGKRYAALDAQV